MTILPLVLDHVSLHARDQVLLDRVSLRISPGPKTVILGPNGAGKSLLLRLCHGLMSPSEGRIMWAGADAGQARPRQAMVFQKPVMLRRSVRANIDYGLKLRKLKPEDRRSRIEGVLSRTGLAARAKQSARALSGGEQQRLALARAWALGPDILFLDEPTASLDPGATAAVESIVEEIHRSGTKIVMTTHDLGQARRLADEVVFLHNGRVTERGHAGRFFRGPQSDAARAFLSGQLMW